MKRLIISASIAVLAILGVQANPITAEKAMEIALQFSHQNQMRSFSGSSENNLRLRHVARNAMGAVDYYVIDREDSEGFIIVSGDDLALPVWGYCEQGWFDYYRLPENLQWWLSEYQSQLQWLRDHPEAHPLKTVALTSSVSPLLKTQWDQIRPYNNYCPATPNGPNGHAYSGCLATALAQIMKYYNHPQRGMGSHSYTFEMNGAPMTLSADFSQSVYQWSKMLNNYYSGNYTTTQADAVARLISDAGIALNMKYGAGSSSAFYKDVPEALAAFFDYSPSFNYLLRNSYEGDWDGTLRSELNASRPIYYFGQKAESYGGGGHAFVMDGYNNDGYFHINWGWGGDYDGYFASGLLSPNGGSNPTASGYNTSQGAIINIRPDAAGEGGVTLRQGVKAESSLMPANNVQASIKLESLGGTYSGTIRLAVATKTGNDSYSWRNIFKKTVTLAANKPTVINFKGSFDIQEGETYYFVLLNPHIPNYNFIWSTPVPFTVGMTGDVNRDKEVNVADVNAVISLILNGGNYKNRADVNGDGEVNLADVNAIISIILK